MYCIDASQPNKSNWLRFVNCPNTFSQQNLVSFVSKMTVIHIFFYEATYTYNIVCVGSGDIFYLALRNISVGEELLVYYGDTYAKNLGIDTTKFF